MATEPTAIIIAVTQKQSIKVCCNAKSLILSVTVCCVFMFSRPHVSHWGSGKVKGFQFTVWLITTDTESLRYLIMIQSLCDPRPPLISLRNKCLVADQTLWQYPWVCLSHQVSRLTLFVSFTPRVFCLICLHCIEEHINSSLQLYFFYLEKKMF